ncbi:MAG: tetratricopeptide repeat protein [Streptosporangiales bacterium]|nr:tetratricopeptide repeat protein [Streptosporangiales bacterium]
MPRAEGGYVLHADEEAVDLYRFDELRTKARSMAESGYYVEAARLFREAEGLWRGEPLAGLPGDWAARRRTALEEDHKASTFERIDVELRLGRHNDLVGELYELVRRYPFDEKPVEHLMLALYRSRRVPEASEVYLNTQRRFTNAGVDLTPELEKLQERILRGDLELAAMPPSGPAFRLTTPNLLRRDIPEFVGRTEEMRQVLDAVAARPKGTAVPVVAIHGMPGVGKTALAVHVAHQLADHYPDAQLYLELRAHHNIQDPVDPAAALGVLLRLVGVPAEQIPQGLDERAALWRAHLANRRVLLVLDDAAGAEQVSPLLPGTPECLVLITSRRRLIGLASVLPLPLDVFPPDDAAELLRRVVGPSRTADAEGVAEVVRLCGYLPLGIHIAGGQLRERRSWSVKDLVARLVWGPHRPGRTRLDDSTVTETFESSYQDLSDREQRMLRRLGLFPGSSFSVYVAAALTGTTWTDSERLLDALYEHHLIEEPSPRRFRLHDLLRDYARDLTLRDDTEPDRGLALDRLLDHYLLAGDWADRVLYPHRRRIDIHAEHPPVEAPPLHTREEAQQWLEVERANLLTAGQYAAAHGRLEHGALLPHVLAGYLETQGYWAEAATAHERAVTLWRDLGDRAGQARAQLELSTIRWRTGHYDEALQQAADALALSHETGNRHVEAESLDRIGLVYWHVGRYLDALQHFEQARDIYRDVGDRQGEADTLSHTGAVSWHVARYDEALSHAQGALELYRAVGDRRGERNALNNVGDMLLRSGRYADALQHYEKALAIVHDIGGPQQEAILLNNVGVVYSYTGDHQRALDCCRRALDIFRDLGDRRCEADALNNVGATYQRMLRHREALIHNQKALAVGREIADPFIQVQALRNISEAHLGRAHYEAAHNSFTMALDLARTMGDLYEEGRALEGIGSVLLHTRGRAEAAPYWQDALARYEHLGVPEAEVLRTRMAAPHATGSEASFL